MEALLLVMRPAGAEPAALPAELQALVPQLFKVLQARLAAQDQDQEVKDAAISVTATALA
ncbi:cullin-associated NEDD8-dissociated 1 isoform A, partial [Haematococcus lacustris]